MKIKRFQETVLENCGAHRMDVENKDVNREAKRKPNVKSISEGKEGEFNGTSWDKKKKKKFKMKIKILLIPIHFRLKVS